jgi:hypothetical protein
MVFDVAEADVTDVFRLATELAGTTKQLGVAPLSRGSKQR